MGIQNETSAMHKCTLHGSSGYIVAVYGNCHPHEYRSDILSKTADKFVPSWIRLKTEAVERPSWL